MLVVSNSDMYCGTLKEVSELHSSEVNLNKSLSDTSSPSSIIHFFYIKENEDEVLVLLDTYLDVML